MATLEFGKTFSELTGFSPFPWQGALYDRFIHNDIPASCNLPTGLGKTSVIAIWLIALANGAKLPRRLVYVVNRRTVVDQTTDEVEKYKRAKAAGIPDFAVSTLRGQFADNREWSADPSRPAVICGTVDMIGSRLLFSGYGVGWKSKPLHAGFLGQDALLVHDESHLEPAFQKLIESIRDEQAREPKTPWPKFRVMELTATSRGDGEAFGLTDDDKANAIVQQRVNAKKAIHLHQQKDKAKLAEQLADLALTFKDSGKTILVFARTVEDVLKIRDKLAAAKLPVETLTGTMRGLERDALVENKTFVRFLPKPPEDATPGTVYLACTSAGEVGVNISADHLVCDLTPFESMAQRLGRVNRFGKRPDTEVHVLYPKADEFEDIPFDQARKKTLALLRDLNGDASPEALGKLDPAARQEAFTPPPTILPATDILFDAWALTTITDKLPGRPPVEPYLHGIADWQPPETHVAWREEVGEITGDLLKDYKPQDLLAEYPLRPHELLREPSYRAFRHFEAMAKRLADLAVPVWLMDDDGKVEVLTLTELADKNNKDRIDGMTVLLPPFAGGLNASGMLDGSAPAPESGSLDVADTAERVRVWSDDEDYDTKTDGMHRVLSIAFPTEDEDAEERTWEWFKVPNEGEPSASKPVAWHVHVGDVEREARRILDRLHLPDDLRTAVAIAAKFHDHGKRRQQFQRGVLGNTKYPERLLAKSGKRGGRVSETYRHEFGSLLDVANELAGEHRDLILHLIAAHHGRARPHFPREEAFDPERSQADAERMAAEVPRRFARLQRKYGRWGLAYLESLLRAADWAASANPSEYVEGDR
jgi:CRISPR-associated endonuclease/helicase Cas3